jgi:phospholipase C
MLTRRSFLQLIGSAGLAVGASDLLAQAVASASPALRSQASNGIGHVVVLMMENRSFDHFLGWLPGAQGRHDLTFMAPDGNAYPNYPLAPDFQGCGYSDPDHSWEGFLVQYNEGRMDGFLQRPTAPADNPGVTLATANTLPIGFYTNRAPGGRPKVEPDLPVIGALAEHYTVCVGQPVGAPRACLGATCRTGPRSCRPKLPDRSRSEPEQRSVRRHRSGCCARSRDRRRIDVAGSRRAPT